MNVGCVLKKESRTLILTTSENVEQIQARLFLDLMEASGLENFFLKENNIDLIAKINDPEEEKILRNLMQVFMSFACSQDRKNIINIYIEKNKGNKTWIIRGKYEKDLCAWLSKREQNFDNIVRIMEDIHIHICDKKSLFVKPQILLGQNAHLIIAWSNFKGIFPFLRNWKLGEGREFYSSNLNARELIVLVAGLNALQNMYIREKIFLHKKSPNYLR